MLDILKNINNILGINERNLNYIRKYNSPAAKRIADDKLLSKKILRDAGIATPKLIGQIKNYKQLEKFNFHKLPGSMVLKPKHGFGGEGIVVFFSKDKFSDWVKADKTRYSDNDLKNHIRGILEGNFSLKNQPDTAFFEERILVHPEFKKYAFRGIPDIRVIVFNKVPVMAQLRLPTKESDGKANLHAGGLCVGIDMNTGITTTAIQRDHFVEEHPDTEQRLRGFKIPFWDKILEIAVQTQIISGLGYLGVDIVIDKINGPMVLELNARPGISIQIANNEGLKSRLERVSGLKIKSVERGIKVAKNLFGGEIEEEIEELSGKKLVGYVEEIEILDRNGDLHKIQARNDTGALWSAIDNELAARLGYSQSLKEFYEFAEAHPFSTLKEGKEVKIKAQREFDDHHEIVDIILVKQAAGLSLRPLIKLPFIMSDTKINTLFSITNRKDMLYHAIIGRKSLQKFLVDPSAKLLN